MMVLRLNKKVFAAISYFPRPYPELKKLVGSFNVQMKAPEILFLGDSVLERVSRDDTDRRTLDKMVAARLGNKKCLLCISHSAYHMKVYFHLLQVLQTTQQKPDIVILPINLRSFSPQWDFEPSWQFKAEIDALIQYVSDSTNGIPTIKKTPDLSSRYEDFDSMEVHYPFSPFSRVGQFRLVITGRPSTNEQKRFRKEQIFVFHYLHCLRSNHPKVEFLRKTINLLTKMGVKGLIYISPINYQGGERYLGDKFTTLFRANVKIIQDCFLAHTDKNTIRFLDLSELLTSDYFFHLDDPTEHLNQQGRAKLAKILSSEVQRFVL